ncbi:hypothetical protein BDF14DRAFT_1958303 [Spinellus fusiger]|nr:hypothetical protein BDF14DRAFT_1958303 [Spinellus fusiger]
MVAMMALFLLLSTILGGPHLCIRLFSRIRHRSSSNSSSNSNASCSSYSSFSSHDPASEAYPPTHENTLETPWDKFNKDCDTAQEEIDCAIETYGSVYYEEDYKTARVAVDKCVDTYLCLQQDMSHTIQPYTNPASRLLQLRVQLDDLSTP